MRWLGRVSLDRKAGGSGPWSYAVCRALLCLTVISWGNQKVAATEKPASKSSVIAAEKTYLDDWTEFRGGSMLRGHRTGKTTDQPRLRWIYDAQAAIESTAAIVDSIVYVGTGEKGLIALKLDPATKKGEVLWTFKVEFGIRSSAGVRDGRVFFGDDLGVFWAVDAKRGEQVWKFDTDTGSEIISSPTFFGDRLVFGSYDAMLYCLDRPKGELQWKFPTDGPVHCTPAVSHGYTFIAGCDEQLRTVALADGKQTTALPLGSYSAASPAVLNDRLFVGTLGNQVTCIRWHGGQASAGRVAEGAVPESVKETSAATDVEARSELLWTYEHPDKKFPYHSSPAVGPLIGADGMRRQVVVIGGRDKMVHALDAETGGSLWTFATKGRVDSSPVIVGQRVIVCSLDGKIYILNLATGKEVWSFNSGSSFSASPAVGGGRLVVGSEEGLIHCFDLRPQEASAGD